MSDATTEKLGLQYDIELSDAFEPSVINNLSLVLEKAFATGLLANLMEDGVINRDPLVGGIDSSTGRIEVPSLNSPLVGFINGKAFIMTQAYETTGSVDSATTTSVVDTSLPGGEDDYWNDAWIIFTSGTESGSVRQISDYDDTQHQLVWSNPLGSAPSAGDTFVVTFYYVDGYTDGTTNYVYGVERDTTAIDGKIAFEARTDSDVLTGEVLLGEVVLDGSGNPTSVDNTIDEADRNLWYGAGAIDYREGTVTLSWSKVDGTGVDVTITHDSYLLRGAVDVELDDSTCSWSIVDASQRDRTTVRVLKEGTTSGSVTITLKIWGRILQYLG